MNTCPRTILVALLSLVMSSVGHASVRAQTVPIPGERVRLRQVDGSLLVGSFRSMSAAEVRLVDESDGVEHAVPSDRIRTFDRGLGRHRQFAKNFLITSAGLSLATGISVWLVVEGLCGEFGGCSNGEGGAAFGAGLMIGAVAGIPIGLLVGLVKEDHRWAPVEIPGSGGSHLTVLPMVGDRPGIVGSISLPRW